MICMGQADSTQVDSTTVESVQIDTTTVPFVAYWGKGDSYNFKVTKIKERWKGGEQTKYDSSSYVVNFLVMDSTATSYTIKWSYETQLTQLNIPTELLEKFAKYNMTEVIYRTSELGEFLAIENWEAISEMMTGLLTDMVEVLAADKGVDKTILEKSMQSIISIYSSQQGIEQLVFNELQYFHFPFGLEYTVDEPILYEEQLPNMFGGAPIRGDAKIYFESVDYEQAFCVLVQEMKLNPDDTKAIILNFFKSMNLDDAKMEKAMETAQFDIIDKNRYEYFYYPGVPYKIETRRESIIDIEAEKGRRVDMTRIELVE